MQARELVLTTVKMDGGGVQLQMLQQWEGNLRARAANVLLVGTDERTCALARNASLPCFVDALVQPPPAAGAAAAAGVAAGVTAKNAKEVNMFGVQVRLKWYYTRALLHAGYHVVFSDSDVAWLRDPLQQWERGFDLQGLSDIYSANLTVHRYHDIRCNHKGKDRLYQHWRRLVVPVPVK